MPTTRPALSNTVKGHMVGSARRRSISAAMRSGEGTAVYQSCQSSPSRAASHSAS